jgi:intracellular multiplication protein IcmE
MSAAELDGMPGGLQSNPELDRLRRLSEERAVAEAKRTGDSHAPSIPAGTTYDPHAMPSGDAVPAITVTAPGMTKGNASTPAPQPTKEDVAAYKSAIDALLKGWGGKESATLAYTLPGKSKSGAEGSRDGVQQAAASAPAVPQQRKRVLIAAGDGVFGMVFVGGNSDQQSPPIIVEALSGPIAHRKLTGSFQAPSNRNGPATDVVIRLTRMTTEDGRQVPIDAIVIAPDSMETAVASRVEPHTMQRIVLPMAAAFVQGLGQALAYSGSTTAVGPLGGFSAFRNFSPEQLIGIGAGSAAQSASQILRDQAPRGSTIFIDRGAEVGILFLSPLEVE